MAANGFDEIRWSTKRRSKRVLRGAGTAHVGGALIAGQPHRPRVGGSLPDRYLLGQGPHRARIMPDNKGRVAESETAAAFHFGLGYVRSNGSQVPRPTGVRWCLVAGRQQATDAGPVGRYTPRSNHHARRLAEPQTRHRTSSQRLHTDHGANDCWWTIAKRCRRRHVMVSSVESVPVVNDHRRNAR